MRTLLLVVALLAMADVAISLSTIAPKVQRPYKRTFLQNVDRFLTKLQKPEEQIKGHTYLSGNYAPVKDILVDQPVVVVEGAIPPGVEGMYVRNGPNPVHNNRLYHWFDGDAMTHHLRFKSDGTASYTNQFVPCTRHEFEKELGEDFFPGLGEYTGILGLIKIILGPPMVEHYLGSDYGLIANPPNTAVFMYRNKFYCLNEANLPFECRILPDGQLEGVGYEKFNGVLNYPISAHPRVDANGDLLFHSYSVSPDCQERDGPMKVGRYSAANDKVEGYFAPVPDQEYVSFAHNLLFTSNYTIIYDCSVHFSPMAMFEGGSFFRHSPEYNLRWGIMPKTATRKEDITWVDTMAPGGLVHPLNSWEEEDGTIVIWTPFCESLLLDLESDEINKFSMVEFRINLQTGEVTKEIIDDTVNVEFSVVETMGEFVRYGYTAIQDPSTPGEGSFTGFTVWDMEERKLAKKVLFDGVGGEPMIIQSKDGKSYVGAYVQKGDQSYFDLFDGVTTERMTRLKMPSRVPFGFHGLWISEKEFQDHLKYHESKR